MNVAEIITNQILEIIETEKILPWRAKWLRHQNIDGKEYGGIVNRVILNYACLKNSYKYPIWLTFNKASQMGLKVKKGAKSEMITYYAVVEKKKDDEENDKKETFHMLKYYRVFNIEEIENYENTPFIAKYNKIKEEDTAGINDLNGYLSSYLCREKIRLNIGGARAFYAPMDDEITMPTKEIFESQSEYYHTLSHEAIHSTGAEKRLNRFQTGEIFGIDNQKYSFEELVAEIGASALASEFNISQDLKNNASYIDGWASYLRENKKTAIFSASKLADKAINFIKGENEN